MCIQLKIAQRTLVNWIKIKDKIIIEYQSVGTTDKTKRIKAIEQPEIDESLTEWFRNLREHKTKVTGHILQAKANE